MIYKFNMLSATDQQTLINQLRPLRAQRPKARRLLYVCAATGICLLGLFAWQHGATLPRRGTVVSLLSTHVPSHETSLLPNPEDGRVAGGRYASDYFSLAYPLPQGWSAGAVGPDPSTVGYYVMAELLPQSEASGTILIAAQDKFFGADPRGSTADMARDFQRAVSKIDGMKIDRELSEMKVADHTLYRVDYSGVGLYRAAVSTEIRCHIVSFNVTTRESGLLATLVHSLDSLSFTGLSSAVNVSSRSPPPCIQDYAVGDNVLHRVTPVSIGPKFTPIPVRIIVDADGDVKYVHVIHATTEQRRSIEEALYQWKLKPYEVNGRPSPVETGLLFKFTAS